ncbi:exo-alpha-sialidase [Trypanosoma cruzi]|nr:exo-alpha-sialidase [Trypanosoma cruzi]
MLGLAGGHTRKAVVSRQLVPAATGARTEMCGAPRGPLHRHAHCNALVEVNADNEPRRWGTLVPALLQKSHFAPVLRQSSSRGNPEGEPPKILRCGSCGHHRSG